MPLLVAGFAGALVIPPAASAGNIPASRQPDAVTGTATANALAAIPGRFVPLAPALLGSVSLAANGSSSVQVTGVGGVPTSGVTAVAVSVVVDSVKATTAVRVSPDGIAASDLNLSVWVATSQARVNTEVLPLSTAGKLTITSSGGPARVKLRLRGYFTTAAGSGSQFLPLPPTSLGTVSLGANGSTTMQVTGVGGVPTSGVTAVAVSVEADLVGANTGIRVFQDGAPSVSGDLSLWVAEHQARVNADVTTLSAAGKLRITTSGGTSRVTVRLRGYFTSTAGAGADFVPLAATELRSVSLPANGTTSFQVTGVGGVPVSGVSAVVVSAFVDHVDATTKLGIFPDGPPTADLSAWVTDHDAAAATEVMRLSSNGRLGMKLTGGAARVTVRLRGYFGSRPVPLAVDQFAPVTAVQASPASGALVGTVEYAYTDNIGRLVHGHQTDPENFTSTQFTVISGLEAFTGTPALAEQADGRLQVVGHNTTGDVWVDTQATKDPAVWGPFTDVGGPMGSHATIARQSDGTLVIFALDTSGQLWALPQAGPNGTYPTWKNLGSTILTGTPVAAVTSTGIQIFALNTTGTLQTAAYTAGTLSGWTSLGGTGLTGTPSVVVLPGSKLRVFTRAADGSILTQAQDATGAFPGVWDTVGTFTAAGPPSALLDPVTGILDVVARGTDGAIYDTGETAQGSGTWRDWAVATQFGDIAATDPTTFTFTTGSTNTWAFVFRRSDNTVRVYTVNEFNGLTETPLTTQTAFTAHSMPTAPDQ